MQVLLKVSDVTEENRKEKFVAGVAELAKALRVPSKLKDESAQHEVPLKAVAKSEEEYLDHMRQVFREITLLVAKRLGLLAKSDVPFRLGTKVVIDPSTGKPLTQRHWKQFEDAIDGYLEVRVKGLAERMAAKQKALGAIMARMERRAVDLDKVELKDIKQPLPTTTKAVQKHLPPEARDQQVFSQRRVAQYVKGVSEKVRNDIMHVINDGVANRTPRSKMVQQLLELDGSWNRDWRRIVETESQDLWQDGALIEELAQAAPGEPIYMVGYGSPGACPVCKQQIINKIVRLLPTPPPDGGERIRDAYTDTAIWPGKSSVGHGREVWAAISRHPHCRCRWVRISMSEAHKRLQTA